MNITVSRLVRTVLFSGAVLTGGMGCHRGANDASPVVITSDAVDCDAPLSPKGHPELAFYVARTQGESSTKVFLRGPSGETLVYVDPQPGELVRVSDDGAHGVYRRFISPGHTADIVVDFPRSAS